MVNLNDFFWAVTSPPMKKASDGRIKAREELPISTLSYGKTSCYSNMTDIKKNIYACTEN